MIIIQIFQEWLKKVFRKYAYDKGDKDDKGDKYLGELNVMIKTWAEVICFKNHSS